MRREVGPSKREGQCGHRNGMRVVGMNDIGSTFTQQPREFPGRGEVHFHPGCKGIEVVRASSSPPKLTVRVDHEDGLVSAGAETKDGQ